MVVRENTKAVPDTNNYFPLAAQFTLPTKIKIGLFTCPLVRFFT